MIKHRRLFYLNSRNKINPTDDDSSCSLELKIPSYEPYTHVCVIDAVIPKSYYLVQAGYNTFTLREGGINATITVPVGNYTATAFRTKVAELMTAGSPFHRTYTITTPSGLTGPTTGKFTYTVTDGLAPEIICTTNLFEQLGFAPNSTNIFVNNTLTSTNVVKFQLEDSLYIHSDIVTNVGDDILHQVYTNGASDFSSIRYACTEWATFSKPLNIAKSNVYRFVLTNEDGRIMNLNGLNWSMTLMLFHETKALMLTTE